MIVKLLAEHHLEFLCLKRGCRGSSESTHIKKPHCWESHAMAHYNVFFSQIRYSYYQVDNIKQLFQYIYICY